MRILVLNYEYPPLGGGAGAATAALATDLAGRGHRVDVVTAGAGAAPSADGEDGGGGSLPGLTIHRVRTARKDPHHVGMTGAASYLIPARPVIRRLLRRHRYDIAQVYFTLPTGIFIPMLARHRVPTVLYLRGSDVPGYDTAHPALQRAHRVLAPLTRRIWRKADRIVALSAALGELARATDPSLRYEVIYNGVDPHLFRPAPRSDREASSDRVFHVLSVARLLPRKRIGDLLHAWSRLERGRFLLEIVGDGREETDLRRLARELELGDDVRFPGFRTRDELAERYREADAFLLVPEAESFGNVFAEAMASGLPIIGPASGGAAEYLSPERNALLVRAGDIDGIVDAVRRLANDLPLRSAMATLNRRDAESLFSWQRVTERHLEIYQGLLDTPHATQDVTTDEPRTAERGAESRGAAMSSADALRTGGSS